MHAEIVIRKDKRMQDKETREGKNTKIYIGSLSLNSYV